MYKINGLEHHHTDVVATLDQDSALAKLHQQKAYAELDEAGMFHDERADEEAEADEPELPEQDPDEEYDRLKADGELASVMRGRGL